MPPPPFSGTPSLLDPTLTFPLTQIMQSGTVGPFERSGSKYWITPVYLLSDNKLHLAAYKSDDNGATFSLINPGFDTAAPIADNSYSTYYPDDGGDIIYIGMRLGATGHLHAVTFNMATDTFIDVSDSGVSTSLTTFYQNQIVKLPNGNLVIVYGAGTVDAIVWNGASWSSPVSIGAGPFSDFVDVVIVTGEGNVGVLWDNSSNFKYTVVTGTTAGSPVDAGAIPSGYQRSFSILEINCSFYDPTTDSFVLGYQHGPTGAGNTISLLIGTPASAPTFRTVDVQVDTGGIYNWADNAIATDGAGNYTFIAWGSVTLPGPVFQDAIYVFTATDLDGPWSLATDPNAVYYNIDTNPPNPAPHTNDLNPLYLRYLADGNIGVTFGSVYDVVTSPPTELLFCGILIYLPDAPPTPPPCGTPIQVSSDPQFRQSASEINPYTFDMGTYLYQVLVASQGEAKIGVSKRLKSDIVGAWVEQDSANSPDNAAQSGYLNVVQNGTKLAVLYLLDDFVSLKIVEFETATDLYGTPTAALTIPSSAGTFCFFLRGSVYTVIGSGGSDTYAVTNTGGTWSSITSLFGAPISILYGGVLNAFGKYFFIYNQVSFHLEFASLDASLVFTHLHTFTNNLRSITETNAIVSLSSTSLAVGFISTAPGGIGFGVTIVNGLNGSPGYVSTPGVYAQGADETISYPTLAVTSTGTLTAFFVKKNIVSMPVVNEIDTAIFNGSAFTGLQPYYDYVANPPSGGPSDTSQVIRALQPLDLLTGWAMSLTLNTTSKQTGFYIDSCGTVVQTLQLNKEVVGGSLSPSDFILTGTGSDSPATVVTGPGPQVGPTAVPAITFDLSEGFGTTWNGATGTWASNSSPWNGGYIAGAWVCTGGGTMPNDHTIIIPAGANIVCTIVNTAPIPPVPPQPGSPCSGPITPQPTTDVQFELRRVYASMKPAPRIPVRGS